MKILGSCMCIGVCPHSTDTHLGNKNDVKCGRGQLCRGREGRSNYSVDGSKTDIFIFHSDSGQYFIKRKVKRKTKEI